MAVNKDKPSAAGRFGSDMRKSRRKAGLNVAVSVAAAAALLIVVNIIGHVVSSERGWRWNMESQGRYGLSESAKRILAQVSDPVRITTLYTSNDPGKKASEYLPPLRDLLEEMRQYRGNITVANVTSDRAKAELVDRLRKQLDEPARDHRLVIGDFAELAKAQQPLYAAEIQKWQQFPLNSWLGRLGLPATFQTLLTETADDLKSSSAKVQAEMAGGLPDYAALVSDIGAAIRRNEDTRLERIRKDLADLAKLPEKALQLRPGLLKDIQSGQDDLKTAVAALAIAGEPADALAKFTQAAKAFNKDAETAARGLEQLGQFPAVAASRSWRSSTGALPDSFRNLGSVAANLGEQAEGVRTQAKTEVQRDAIDNLRKAMPILTQEAARLQASVTTLLDGLDKLDDQSKAALREGLTDDFLAAEIQPLRLLQDRIDKLPTLQNNSELVNNIKQDNVVLVETHDQIGLIPFDDIWPVSTRRGMTPEDSASPPRAFYGDMAISAKLLRMSAENFGEVMFVYYERIPPRQMWQQTPPVLGAIASMDLTVLRERLAKANLEVTDWNLAKQKEMPAAGPAKADSASGPASQAASRPARPRVLIVLPPPELNPLAPAPPGGTFGPAEIQAVTQAISAGTPAVFLAGYFGAEMPGMPTPGYGWNAYLSHDWALTAQTTYRVIAAARNPQEPDKFMLPLVRWDFMPLSTFTDIPLARPLQARRFYWLRCCPVASVKAATDAQAVGVLEVPKGQDAMWASADPDKLIQQMLAGRSNAVRIDKSRDLLPPFWIAALAQRNIGGKEVKVAVLGNGMSFIDAYLTAPIPQLRGDTLTNEPPPTGNVDLVINTLYDMMGKTQYIGSGPAVIEPIGILSEGMMARIQWVFGLGWPLMVLLVGGMVMAWRKR